jgi:hypothetical protein
VRFLRREKRRPDPGYDAAPVPDRPRTARNAAADLVRKAAQNRTVRKAAAAAATSAGSWLAKSGVERFDARKAARQQVALAEGLARQIGGKISYATVIGTETYTVVWSEGTPVAAFPPIDGHEGLEQRPELQGFAESSLKDPPPEHGGRAHRLLGGRERS